jgi:hypothetical protein
MSGYDKKQRKRRWKGWWLTRMQYAYRGLIDVYIGMRLRERCRVQFDDSVQWFWSIHAVQMVDRAVSLIVKWCSFQKRWIQEPPYETATISKYIIQSNNRQPAYQAVINSGASCEAATISNPIVQPLYCEWLVRKDTHQVVINPGASCEAATVSKFVIGPNNRSFGLYIQTKVRTRDISVRASEGVFQLYDYGFGSVSKL